MLLNNSIGSMPYKNGVMIAPARCSGPVNSKSPPLETATATAAGGKTLNKTAGVEKVFWRVHGNFSCDVLPMMLSYSSARDIIHPIEEPINEDAVKAANMAPPAPLDNELSRPPPKTAKHHATYIAIGMNDPSAIAMVDFVLSKLSSFVMDGTMF